MPWGGGAVAVSKADWKEEITLDSHMKSQMATTNTEKENLFIP